MSDEKIPFRVETRRIIELLANQIYQSPLALLRENIQNAYDAILMRKIRGEPDYEPKIIVELSSSQIVVKDNGVGMTKEVITDNFWKAGSSGKNNDTARAAGVVGTFGIGGMANFGIAGELRIETESIDSGLRYVSHAKVDELELNQDCISVSASSPTGEFGTQITALLLPGQSLDIGRATAYIEEFASALPIPLYVNAALVSQKSIESLVPMVSQAWIHEANQVTLAPHFTANVKMVGSQNADIWIRLSNILWAGNALRGMIVLRSGTAHIKTFRSGFGLAPASAPSAYSFGGAVNLNNLFPTAGREALTTESVQFLHSVMPSIDALVSEVLSTRPECDSSTPFMNWALSRNRFELCSLLKMNINPGGTKTLAEIAEKFQGGPANAYTGNDQSIISAYANEDSPLLVFASGNPRRSCQEGFLRQRITIDQIPDSPRVVDVAEAKSLTQSEGSMVFRIGMILEEDYFVRADIRFASISHGLPVFVSKDQDELKIYINRDAPAVSVVRNLYSEDFSAFSSIVKDFVRSNIFDRIASFVPSSTRSGAEEFLKAIRRKREVFEIDIDESDAFSSIWDKYASGEIKMSDAISRAGQTARSSVQTLDRNTSAPVDEVLPDVIQREAQLRASAGEVQGSYGAEPPIMREEVMSSAKLLTIEANQDPLHGYRCFLSLTDKARGELGEFFHDPHKTSVVWGGNRVLFIFMHHSERYGLYYDIQTSTPVSGAASGSSFQTCTLVLKNKIFIPIPEQLADSFVPGPEDKRKFEIRFDIIRADG